MRILSCIFLTFLLLFLTSALNAHIIYVPSDSSTIQGGINGAVNGDTVLVADGTYTGDGNRDIDFLGKAIVVMSENGPEVTIIDCEGGPDYHRGVYFHSWEDSTSVLQGFTITNGYHDDGGGMLNYNSNPTITNCTFSRNESHYDGGGMRNSFSNPTVTNCTFIGNSAELGGGMHNHYNSSPTITDCTFIGNSAYFDGGGVVNYNNSNPTITNCTFSRNEVYYFNGGGMYNWGNSSPTVTNCTFSENMADVDGGGMCNNGGNPLVTDCTFSGNSAHKGGGMYNYNSNPTITNCTFIGNFADPTGGGMYNWGNSPIVTNCILWGDNPNEIGNYNSIPIVTYSDVQDGYPGEGNLDADPLFVLPDKHDFRLLWGSPCIDAGDPGLLDPDETRSDMGAHFFDQRDYLTLYLTPDTTEVAKGGQLGVTYTLINHWDQPEPFLGLTLVILPNGNPFNLIGPNQFALPANTMIQQHFDHNVPPAAPLGQYDYWTQIGLPPSTLYDEDRFTFSVVE